MACQGKKKIFDCFLKKLGGPKQLDNDQQAADYVKELLTLKVPSSVKQSQTEHGDLLNVDMYIEDRLVRQGPIPLKLPMLMSVTELKDKISNIFNIPVNMQYWTINNKVADDNNATLDNLQVVEDSAVVLYLVAPNLQAFNKVKRQRIELDLYDLSGLYDDDDNDDKKVENCDYKLHQEVIEKSENSNTNVELIEKSDKNTNILIEDIPLVDDTKPAADINHEEQMHEEIAIEKAEKKFRDVIYDIIELGIVENRTKVTEIEVINEIVPDNPIELVKEKEPKEYHELMMLANWEVVPNTDYFNCPICLVDFEPYDGIQLYECLHTFCRDCLINTIKHSESPQIGCPYIDEVYACESIILEREIKALVNPDIYEQYLSKSLKQAENCAGENAFHCKTPNCNVWCYYDADREYFWCPKCGKTNCLKCKVIHEESNCKEYQENLNMKDNSDYATNLTQEALDKWLEKGEAMKCPICKIVVVKDNGCDLIHCTICKTQICWATKGLRWGPNGVGDTSGGCRCNVNGLLCHPSCRNCH